MLKKYFLIACFILPGSLAWSQNSTPDTTLSVLANDIFAIDTSIDYDDLMNELDLFLDSILAPRSYFLANLSIARGNLSYANKTKTRIRALKKSVWSPTLGYYDKSGLGITATGNIINDSSHLNLYQFCISPSYDYVKNRNFATGISYFRYFNKDSLPFYTSPLQNEIYSYFLWRKSWLEPGIAVSYGWGSRTQYNKVEKYVRLLNTANNTQGGGVIVTDTTTHESIVDFSLTASLKHDFYLLNIFSNKDNIRITPQLSFTSGTQKFGFNQTTSRYSATRYSVVSSTGNVDLDQKMKFQPISLTLYLRTEYSIGKFFIQPQLLFDYYFPAKSKNFTTLFSLNTGFIF